MSSRPLISQEAYLENDKTTTLVTGVLLSYVSRVAIPEEGKKGKFMKQKRGIHYVNIWAGRRVKLRIIREI